MTGDVTLDDAAFAHLEWQASSPLIEVRVDVDILKAFTAELRRLRADADERDLAVAEAVQEACARATMRLGWSTEPTSAIRALDLDAVIQGVKS